MSDKGLKNPESGFALNQTSPSRSETTFQESEILHIWAINNFSLCSKERGQYIRSATFSSKLKVDRNKWCLELYPSGIGPFGVIQNLVKPTSSLFTLPLPTQNHEVDESSKFLSLYLRLVSSTESHVSVKYKMSIVNNKEEFVTRVTDKGVVKVGGTVPKSEQFIGSEELMKQKEELLPGDTLTLACEITTLNESTNAFFGGCAASRISECRFQRDFGGLWENQQLSDVILVGLDGREFPAHKAVLGARSSVFAAMFQNEMAENKHNKVVIADMGNDVLTEVLRFIYTGTAKNLDKIAAELLAASDKYDLKGLLCFCEKSLSDSLAVETAAEMLVLADMHQIEDLKMAAIDFILGHSEQVKKTEGWMMMTKSHPQLIIEALMFKPTKQEMQAAFVWKQDSK